MRTRVQPLTCVRELHAARASHQERNPRVGLQLAQRFGQRGLRNKQRSRSSADAAMLDDSDQCQQLMESQIHADVTRPNDVALNGVG